VDAQLAVARDGDTVVVTVEMMRDGPEGTEVVSTVESVVVGEDQNGKELTSLVVVPSEGTPLGRGGHRGWPRSLMLFEQALKEALIAHSEVIHELADPYSPEVRAVDLEAVRIEFYSTYPAKGETDAQRQDSRRQQFHRCVTRAQTDGLVRVRVLPSKKTMVWPTGLSAEYNRAATPRNLQ
jgi:hypothetical protein